MGCCQSTPRVRRSDFLKKAIERQNERALQGGYNLAGRPGATRTIRTPSPSQPPSHRARSATPRSPSPTAQMSSQALRTTTTAVRVHASKSHPQQAPQASTKKAAAKVQIDTPPHPSASIQRNTEQSLRKFPKTPRLPANVVKAKAANTVTNAASTVSTKRNAVKATATGPKAALKGNAAVLSMNAGKERSVPKPSKPVLRNEPFAETHAALAGAPAEVEHMHSPSPTQLETTLVGSSEESASNSKNENEDHNEFVNAYENVSVSSATSGSMLGSEWRGPSVDVAAEDDSDDAEEEVEEVAQEGAHEEQIQKEAVEAPLKDTPPPPQVVAKPAADVTPPSPACSMKPQRLPATRPPVGKNPPTLKQSNKSSRQKSVG